MRESFTKDWMFAIRNFLESGVERKFPQELHSWPVLKVYHAECYACRGTHMVFVLKDRVSGIPVINGRPKILDDPSCPEEIPTLHNLTEWQDFLLKKFSTRSQDAVVIIPVIDSGKGFEDDWKLLKEDEKQLLHRQVEINLMQQFYYRKGIDVTAGFYIPPGYQFLTEECGRFFQEHPRYDRNILIMTRLERGNRLLEELDQELRRVLNSHSLDPVRADDKMYMRDRNLWNNVCLYMI